MSETKIKVPDGMLKAAMRASMDAGLAIGPSTELRVPLEAALLWQRENMCSLSDAEFGEMVKTCREARPDGWECLTEWSRAIILCDYRVRFMYDAQETEHYFYETPFGKFEVDNRVPPGEIRLHQWNGPTLIKNIKVPE
jgi:hypothetical protein